MSDEMTKPEKDAVLAEAALQAKDVDKLFQLFTEAQKDATMILRATAIIAESKHSSPEQVVTLSAIEALKTVALRAMDLVAADRKAGQQ